MTKEPEKKKNHLALIMELSVIAVVIVVIVIIYLPSSPPSSIKISELPLEKLNQGYDIVCNSRDHQTLCAYNETDRTQFNQSGIVNRPDPITNQTITHQIFEIKITNKEHCFKEYHAELKNQTQPYCYGGVDFPKDVWSMDSLGNSNGFPLFVFYNRSRTQ